MHSFFPTMSEALTTLLQNYQVIWWIPRPPFAIQEDLPATINYLKKTMITTKESPLEVKDIVFCSWQSASAELKEITRSEDSFISAIKIVTLTTNLIREEKAIQLKSLPQPFQLIHAVLPPQSGFNPILQIEEEQTISNPMYEGLDNTEIQQAALVHAFFETAGPEERLRIRCMLEHIGVDISKVYLKLLKGDIKIETLKKAASCLLPPLLDIIRGYLTGAPRPIRR